MSAARAALAPALAGAALRLALAALLPLTPRWDGHWYAALATRLADGAGYTEGHAATAFWPPGLPLALAAVMRLTGAEVEAATLAVNLVATALATWAAAAMTDDPRVAKRASWIVALYPGLALWSLATMTETLTAALAVGSLALLRRPGPRHVALAGIAAGLAALARPPSLLLTLAAWPARRSWRALALCAACALAVVAPWAARNALALDGPALVSTNGGSNLYIGTTPESGGGYLRPGVDALCPDAHGEVARDRCLTRLALARVSRAPLRQVDLAARKLLRTVAVEVDPAAWHFAKVEGALDPRAVALGVLCTAAWWGLVLLAIRGSRLTSREALAPTAWAVGLTLATHAVFIGADRYHLVLVPTLAPLAARGWRR